MPSTDASAPWPTYQTLFRIEGARPFYIRRRLRVAAQTLRARRLAQPLDDAVGRYPWLRPLLVAQPILFRPVIGPFLDARLCSAAERIASYAFDLEFTARRIRAVWPQFFASDLVTTLWREPASGWSIELGLNTDFPQEGLWRIALRTPACERRVFALCFSVLPGPVAVVGNIQGGRPVDGADALPVIRDATKVFEGLRPPYALLEALRILARAWGIGSIVGIARDHHLKAHSASRTAALVRFDYDRFWTETAAQKTTDGNWLLTCRAPERAVTDVPPRKRAMYRRRASLLTDMEQVILNALRRGEAMSEQPAPPRGLAATCPVRPLVTGVTV